ncbi:MAG: hypothetical protein JWR32_6400 [Mycobacterium sp.]|jgi:hypothetical protein|nr:hypothetical protein [Mycobacterium sp.]
MDIRKLADDVPKFVVPRSPRCDRVPLISHASVFIQSPLNHTALDR